MNSKNNQLPLIYTKICILNINAWKDMTHMTLVSDLYIGFVQMTSIVDLKFTTWLDLPINNWLLDDCLWYTKRIYIFYSVLAHL